MPSPPSSQLLFPYRTSVNPHATGHRSNARPGRRIDDRTGDRRAQMHPANSVGVKRNPVSDFSDGAPRLPPVRAARRQCSMTIDSRESSNVLYSKECPMTNAKSNPNHQARMPADMAVPSPSALHWALDI